MRDAWVPLLFIEELRAAVEGFNLQRKANGMAPLEIECFLALNDEDPDALGLLKSHAEPLIAAARAEVPKLDLQVRYFQKPFYAYTRGLSKIPICRCSRLLAASGARPIRSTRTIRYG
ncbi:MAG: hypothetical protein WB495_17155 [Xanthobacteraceae bacterium]